MSRAEINRKFDDIVDFAGVEKFLDTPVKRYSSGMQVRLAFAVAAHLEPEILIVDEVLAVGDAEFQKKCLGKMGEVARQGRTVLFVSHNLSTVASLCTAGMLLRGGTLRHYGKVEDALASYLSEADGRSALVGKRIDVSARANRVRIGASEAVNLEFDVTLRGPLRDPRVGIGINDAQGVRLATIFTETMVRLSPLEEGESCVFKALTEPVHLAPGNFLLKVSLADEGRDIEVHHDAIHVVIPEYNPFRFPPFGKPLGPIRLPLQRISCK
jgi:lipopolysaccharide transport system ATP-binding protein